MSSFSVEILIPLTPINRNRSQSDGLKFSGTWEPDMSFKPDSAIMLSCYVMLNSIAPVFRKMTICIAMSTKRDYDNG